MLFVGGGQWRRYNNYLDFGQEFDGEVEVDEGGYMNFNKISHTN